MDTIFTYGEFTTRNIGFVTVEEQEILRNSRVFVPGVGGMGGFAVAALARAGVENFIIADIDTFEVSNLNRQIFSFVDAVGKDKAEAAKKNLENINPGIKVKVCGGDWLDNLDEILKTTDIVINGCDDIKSTILLMRKCREYKLPAIDAFASPLPNVYVIRAQDSRPEEVFGFPTVNLGPDGITAELAKQCFLKEMEHLAVHSTSMSYVDLDIAREIINGTRKRISFAPMVWTTGCMMAYEAIRQLLKKEGGPGVKGIFYNPWTCETEKPKGKIWAFIRRYFVRKRLEKLANGRN